MITINYLFTHFVPYLESTLSYLSLLLLAFILLHNFSPFFLSYIGVNLYILLFLFPVSYDECVYRMQIENNIYVYEKKGE